MIKWVKKYNSRKNKYPAVWFMGLPAFVFALILYGVQDMLSGDGMGIFIIFLIIPILVVCLIYISFQLLIFRYWFSISYSLLMIVWALGALFILGDMLMQMFGAMISLHVLEYIIYGCFWVSLILYPLQLIYYTAEYFYKNR